MDGWKEWKRVRIGSQPSQIQRPGRNVLRSLRLSMIGMSAQWVHDRLEGLGQPVVPSGDQRAAGSAARAGQAPARPHLSDDVDVLTRAGQRLRALPVPALGDPRARPSQSQDVAATGRWSRRERRHGAPRWSVRADNCTTDAPRRSFLVSRPHQASGV